MIITGGLARGRRVSAPEGLDVRPTGSKTRQALFNILAPNVPEAAVLDVFAGTGLIGLEALSRGAASVTFVEESGKMVRAIQTSLTDLGFEAEVRHGDFRQILPHLKSGTYDIIFGDPPYKTNFPTLLLKTVERLHLLSPDGVLVIEHQRGYKFPEEELTRLVKSDTRHYGQSSLTFFRRSEK